MYRIAVCDDCLSTAENIRTYLKAYQAENKMDFSIHLFTDGAALLASSVKFDLIFLDIEMPEIDGIETAKAIRLHDKEAAVIYVTSHSSYAIRVFAVHPFDFIVKPCKKEDIYRVVCDYIGYASKKALPPMIELKGRTGSFTLSLDEIIAFEYVENRRMKVYLPEKEYEIKGSITEMMRLIGFDSFTSPHKSFIINMKHVKRIHDFTICMQNGIEVPVAQKRLKEFRMELNHYMHKYIIQE